MTKFQKRVYLLILRSLLLLLYYKFHSPDKRLEADHSTLRQDLHNAIMILAGKRGDEKLE